MKNVVDIKGNMDLVASRMTPNFLKVLWVMLRDRCMIDFRTRLLLVGKLKVGKGTVIRGGTIVAKSDRETGITIGNRCLVQDYISMHSRGDFISVGDGVLINSFCYIDGHGGVTIGNNCLIGPGVKMVGNYEPSADRDALPHSWRMRKQGITIGENVWVGANTTIIDGAKIGRGCVIGANAVVNKDIPEYTVAAGVPAKVIRQR
jgi:acetyltransferase-like isoleucine patch superfamily enzyme